MQGRKTTVEVMMACDNIILRPARRSTPTLEALAGDDSVTTKTSPDSPPTPA